MSVCPVCNHRVIMGSANKEKVHGVWTHKHGLKSFALLKKAKRRVLRDEKRAKMKRLAAAKEMALVISGKKVETKPMSLSRLFRYFLGKAHLEERR